jgi:hypothetical protein
MKKIVSILIFFFLLTSFNIAFATYGIQTKTSGCLANQALPDPACTPGAVLTTSTSVICKVGYTKTVRNVSTSTKKKVFKEYGIAWSKRSNYEVDHLISLELGGSNDISNLFPESHSIQDNSYTKDTFENYLHKQVCTGKLSITDAQYEISSNWLSYDLARLSPSKTPTAPTVVIPVVTAPTSRIQLQNSATAPLSVEPAVKKSTTGLCHAVGTTYYDRTTHYTAYASIADCLASGGRLTAK